MVSGFIQFFTGFNVKYSLFGDSSCQLTGFPIAKCIYDPSGSYGSLIIQITNIVFWFVILSLLLGFFGKRSFGNKGSKK